MVCVCSADPLFARMLALEVEREGYTIVPLDAAKVLLLDLAALPPLLSPPAACRTVAFAQDPQRAVLPVGFRADAILSRPFRVAELRRALWRYAVPDTPLEDIRLLPDGIIESGQKIAFSPTETALFALLFENRGKMVPTQTLLQVLPANRKANDLAVMLYRLRQKIAVCQHLRITAKRGVGYTLS